MLKLASQRARVDRQKKNQENLKARSTIALRLIDMQVSSELRIENASVCFKCT